MVLSIPDWGMTPFAQGRDRERIGREIDAFNEANLREAEAAGAHYVDVTGISREAARHPELLAEDGLHPSAAMYGRWVEAALPVARRILEGGPGLSGNDDRTSHGIRAADGGGRGLERPPGSG
jgi:hypothetical protein